MENQENMNQDENLNFENRIDLSKLKDAVEQIKSELSKIIIGQEAFMDLLLVALLSDGHVLIEGVPGVAKTVTAKLLSKTIKTGFSRIQFTPDLMPSDVTGHAMYDIKTEEFRIRKGPVFTNLLLADEINQAPAKSQSALLEVMQEQQVTIEGNPFAVSLPFMTLATQNPIEQEGTYPLPEAQLDRFLLKIKISYPSQIEETKLIKQVTTAKTGETLDIKAIKTLIKPESILTLQRIVANLQVDDRIYEYAVKIVRGTRTWSGISLGAGPRGGIALIRSARAAALLAGHDFVTPDDIKNIAIPALRHRITLAPELEIEGYDVDMVLNEMLSKIEAPRI